MVLIQVLTTGQILLTKVVVDDGLSVCTLLTYRFFMGAILVIPLAMIFEKLALLLQECHIADCYFHVVNTFMRLIEVINRRRNIVLSCDTFSN